MQQLEDRMAAEKARIAEFSQTKQDELSQRLQQATLDVQEAERVLKQAEALVVEKKDEVTAVRAQGDETEREVQTARKSVMGLREQIQRCVEQRNNSLAPYGKDLKNFLERIGKMRWHGQKPLGPFGVYVKVRDRTWADLLRNVLGSHMSSFAVTDSRDLPVLKKLLRESGKCVYFVFFHPQLLMIISPNINVIVSEVDLFDYSSGEPAPQYRTVLRVIDVSLTPTLALILDIQYPPSQVSNEFVLRILINQAKIERMLLAPTRSAADDLLRSVNGGRQCLTADLWRVQRWRFVSPPPFGCPCVTLSNLTSAMVVGSRSRCNH